MNLLGIGISYGYIFLLLMTSTIINKYQIVSKEQSRKFIHIGFGHWWMIAMVFFDNVFYAAFVPTTLIVLNYLSHKFNLVKAMEREGEKDLGTVYYSISLLILVIFSFGLVNKTYIGAIGIFIMAYGDGFAAIIGKKFKSRKIYHNKTLYGTLTMFIMSVLVTTIISVLFNYNNLLLSVLIVPLFATLLELYSKKGLDNLAVPLLSSLIYYLIVIL